jgi:hypothetical protein
VALYEDLVTRAIAAREQARTLTVDAARVSRLSRALREARTGKAMLLRCAWCERLEVGGEWLRLEAIGSGQTKITEELVRQSTHGICPDCFGRVSRDVAAHRAERLR